MKNGFRHREVKFPENKRIAAKLNRGDRVIIADRVGVKPGTIRDILNGFRKMPDNVKKAIIEIMNERQKLDRALEEITNQ